MKLKTIEIRKKPNFWGKLAIHIIKFGTWLFERTGNGLEREKE